VYFDDAPAGSGNERDHWRELIRQKLKACEYDKPLVQRLTAWLDDNFIALKGSLLLILLPPFSLLLLGYCVGWVVKGFVS
jgi:hypothetical protein